MNATVARLLLFATLSLGLLVAKAPASLLDALLARYTEGGLRLQGAEGSLWQGSGVLASRDASGRSLSPWLPLSWEFQAAALGRLALAWRFTGSSPLGEVEAGPRGLELTDIRLQASADAVLSPIPHPAARAGWQGDLNLSVPHWQCGLDGRCSGQAHLLWRGARSALFPGRNFGDYEVQLSAEMGRVGYTIHTLSGEVRLDGHGEAEAGRSPSFAGSLIGDPAFLSRLPAIAGGAAQAGARPGEFVIRWPPR